MANKMKQKQENNEHYVCAMDHTNHRDIIAQNSVFMNHHLQMRFIKDKQIKRDKYIEMYKNDKEIQNYINSLSSIVNQKKAITSLALFLLSKYRCNYLLLPKGIDPVD